ncbi:MAG: acyltransferase family protein [Bacteroidota bacterium]
MINRLEKNDFIILDSIRGIASLYVMIAHSRGILWMGGKVFMEKHPMEHWGMYEYFIFSSSLLTRLAVEFVILFFVLSGFSIAYSLRNQGENKLFYLKRFLRIYPPYVLALVWAAAVFFITKAMNPEFYRIDYDTLAFTRYLQMNHFFEPLTILKNLVYLPMEGFITPFWSLSFEVIFYLVAPFILLKRKLYYIVSVVCFVAGLALEKQLNGLQIPYLIREFIFTYNFFFMLGIWLFWNYSAIMTYVDKVNKWILLLGIFFFLGMTYAVNIYFQYETKYSFISSALFAVLLIIYFLKYKVEIKFLQSIGKYSYTLYITHVASLFLLHSIYFRFFGFKPPHLENFWLFVPGIFFSLGIAYLMYVLCEKQTKNWIGKIREKR